MEIEEKVLLLAILKQQDLDAKEILLQLEETGMFTLKDGKKVLKKLKDAEFVNDNGLTMIGIEKAKEAEKEFKV